MMRYIGIMLLLVYNSAQMIVFAVYFIYNSIGITDKTFL
nr:hypothetical protein [Mucilaginibacter sp. SP1R1]